MGWLTETRLSGAEDLQRFSIACNKTRHRLARPVSDAQLVNLLSSSWSQLCVCLSKTVEATVMEQCNILTSFVKCTYSYSCMLVWEELKLHWVLWLHLRQGNYTEISRTRTDLTPQHRGNLGWKSPQANRKRREVRRIDITFQPVKVKDVTSIQHGTWNDKIWFDSWYFCQRSYHPTRS